MKIILSGGGTLGPVTTVLAIVEACRKAGLDCDFLWVGTKNGPERRVVQSAHIRYQEISAGKLRRYFSVLNFFDIFRVAGAFFESISLLNTEKPDLLISAGGFVSVPLHWAARFLNIPSWIHQQDARPGLANKLMAKSASKITVALESSKKYFPASKTEWLGNPCRDVTADVNQSKKFFGIADSEPVILAVGGGTGAVKLNHMVMNALPLLPKSWHVIHIVGKERSADECHRIMLLYPNYRVYSFLNEEMKYALNCADIVFTRAGFATLSELSALKKTAVLLPISDTHQEENAALLVEVGAAFVLDERITGGAELADSLRRLSADRNKREDMGRRLNQAVPIAREDKISQIIIELIKK